MMDFQNFQTILSQSLELPLRFVLGHETMLPLHFHVTEIGNVTKDFVDCGGTRRTISACILQTLVADDIDHRLTAKKLSRIVEKSSCLAINPASNVEVEIQGRTIEVYAVSAVEITETELVVQLQPKETACLAPDRCGIGSLPVFQAANCDGENNCC